MTSLISYPLLVLIIWQHILHVFSHTPIDLNKCKVTHKGLEYTGTISKTKSGRRCQYWAAKHPVHKPSDSIKDEHFPEGFKKLAKNFCRNPTQEAQPWCYTMDPEVEREPCSIPFCNFGECRISAIGAEYSGSVHKTITETNCLPWDNELVPADIDDSKFPNLSRAIAGSKCRNPNDSQGGPWCYVDKGMGEIASEFCDVPYCDEPLCKTYSEGSVHGHYTSLNKSSSNFTFGVKLWDSTGGHDEVHIVLTTLAHPYDLVYDIVISNTKTGLKKYIDDPEMEVDENTHILSSLRWTMFWVTWEDGYVTLGLEDEEEPLFIHEDDDGKVVHPEYYSLSGNALWSLGCFEECEVHTTIFGEFSRHWKIRKTASGRDIHFYLRAVHSACLQLRVANSIFYPKLEVVIGEENLTYVIVYTVEDGEGEILGQNNVAKILYYWDWHEFTLNLFGDRLQLFWVRGLETRTIFEIRHSVVRHLRWFSPDSRNSTAHWTFFCSPPEYANAPPPYPPDCAISKFAPDYVGHNWVTRTGLACLSWSHPKGPHKIPKKLRKDNLYRDGSRAAAKNYCRNPDRDKNGPWCFTVFPSIKKDYCKIRMCRSRDCKMSGVGIDYMGNINVTRSGRECQSWLASRPHKVDREYLNETFYADRSLRNASNFCRNPSRNIAGPWCYTRDKNVESDLCDVYDCVKPEKCILLVRGLGRGRLLYVIPDWKTQGLYFSLKEWDPEKIDGIVFLFQPMIDDIYYKLAIGVDKNEKVQIFYGVNDKEKLLKEKTLPHLIPIGKWGAFWIKAKRGNIMLGVAGVQDPLFDYEDKDHPFNPIFLTFQSLLGNTIGVTFRCDQCHTEVTTTARVTKVLPIGLWDEESSKHYHNLTLYVRGVGTAIVPLLKLPGGGRYYAVIINDFGKYLNFIWNDQTTTKNIAFAQKPDLLLERKWTKYVIYFYETNLIVEKNNEEILNYNHTEPFLFYYFSVTAEGNVTWSANCKPVDIDGAPRHGGWSVWSSWSCSVSCGGGTGIRKRSCTKPTPNVFGNGCEGPSTLTGTCNDFPCGEISRDTLVLVRTALQNKHFNVKHKSGDSISVKCNKTLTSKILSESPKADIVWTKDGSEVESGNRIELEKTELFIRKSQPSDTGVYACVVRLDRKRKMVITVTSVCVTTSKYTMYVRRTQPLTLKCNNLVLGYLYFALQQKWMLNGHEWKHYGYITAEAVNTEVIPKAQSSHEGVWECVVWQSDLNFTWTSNWINVEVKQAPNILNKLMEDPLTSKIFGPMKYEVVVFLVLVLILASVIYTVYIVTSKYIQWLNALRRKRPPKTRKSKKRKRESPEIDEETELLTLSETTEDTEIIQENAN